MIDKSYCDGSKLLTGQIKKDKINLVRKQFKPNV